MIRKFLRKLRWSIEGRLRKLFGLPDISVAWYGYQRYGVCHKDWRFLYAHTPRP